MEKSISNCSFLSEKSLHLSIKPPEMKKSLWPSDAISKSPPAIMNLYNTMKSQEHDGLSKYASSPRRKKYSINKRKSKKNILNLEALEKAGKSNEVFKIILSKLTERAKRTVLNFTENIKRKHYFSSIRNLKSYHFGLIKDSVAFHKNKRKLKGSLFFKMLRINKLWHAIKSLPLMSKVLTFLSICSKKATNFLIHNKNLLNPNSPIKVIWDLTVLIFTLVQLFSFSIEQSFDVNLEMNSFQYFLAFIYYLDLIITLNTKMFKQGLPVTNRFLILKNLVTKKFFSDVLPCLLLSFLIYIKDGNFSQYLNLGLFGKVIKAKKIEGRVKELIIKSRKPDALYQMFLLVLKIICWAHIIAVLWHFVSYSSLKSNSDGENWLKIKGISDKSWKIKYLFSIYWGVTTMLTVGYGDITPANSNEMLYNILAMFIGCGIFGYSMNRIGEILNHYHRKTNYLNEQMSKVSFMLKDKKLPLETQTKIKRYLEFVLKQELREDPDQENFILNKLSSELRNEIFLHTNVKYLRTVPAFKKFNEKTLIVLARHMKKVCFCPEEYVYREGDYENPSIYFVLEGNLKLVSVRDEKVATIWTKFKKDNFFGEREVFTGLSRSLGVISLGFSTLFKLSHNDIVQVLRKHPKEYEKFCEIKDLEILYNNYTQYDKPCYSCDKRDHPVEHCDFLNFDPGKRGVIYNYNRLHKLKMKKFKRKNNKQFNALAQINEATQAQEEFLVVYSDDEEVNELCQMYSSEGEEIRRDCVGLEIDQNAKDTESSVTEKPVIKDNVNKQKVKEIRLKRNSVRFNSNINTEKIPASLDICLEDNNSPYGSMRDYNFGSFTQNLLQHDNKDESNDDANRSQREFTLCRAPQEVADYPKSPMMNKGEKTLIFKQPQRRVILNPDLAENKVRKKTRIQVNPVVPVSEIISSKFTNTQGLGQASNTNQEIREPQMEKVKVFEFYFPRNNITEIQSSQDNIFRSLFI